MINPCADPQSYFRHMSQHDRMAYYLIAAAAWRESGQYANAAPYRAVYEREAAFCEGEARKIALRISRRMADARDRTAQMNAGSR